MHIYVQYYQSSIPTHSDSYSTLLPLLKLMSQSPDYDDDIYSNIPQDPTEDITQARLTGKPPSFQSLMYPIRTVCDRSSYINGFRFEFAMGLSEKFQMVHSWNLLNKTEQKKNPMKPQPKSAYSYNLTYGYPSAMQPDVILMARGQGQGKLQAFMIKNLTPQLSMRISAGFMNSNIQQGMLGMDLDYETKQSNVGLKLTSGYLNFSWVERVHKNIILGFDYMKMLNQNISVFGYGAKLLFGNQNFYAQYLASQALFMIGHELKLKNKTKIVSSFSYQKMKQKTTTMIGLKKQFLGNELIATINSRGKVSTSVSMMMGNQIPLKVRLCSIVDYYKDSYKFGYGLSIGT